MDKNITLIIVDFQFDFYSPSGALYVPGAEKVCPHIVELLKSGNVANVFFTVDWHPAQHCSFKVNGGIWPVHCLQYTLGAAISDKLLTTCVKYQIPYRVIRKGTSPSKEEYSAFTEIKDREKSFNVTSDSEIFEFSKQLPIVVCGLAGDYCVLESIKSLRAYQPQYFMPGIAFIDGTHSFLSFMNEEGLKPFTL